MKRRGRDRFEAGIDADVREELEFHLEMRVRESIAKGMSREEAQAEAERRFGRTEQYAAEMRATEFRRAQRGRRHRLLSNVGHDVRFGLRGIARRPQFAAIVVLTLAIGIGAGTTIFSFANRLLFTEVAGVRDPGTLATVTFSRDENRRVSFVVSHVDYTDLREAIVPLSELAGVYEVDVHLRVPGSDVPRRVLAEMATSNYAATLGLMPVAGRAPVVGPGDDVRVVMISDALWRDAFDRSAAAIGEALIVNGEPFVITGVAPPGFRGHGENGVDLWLPVDAHAHLLPIYPSNLLTERRNTLYLTFIARIPEGSLAQVESALRAAVERIVELHPESSLKGMLANVTQGVGFTPWEREELTGTLRILGAVVAFLLLLACANAANLLLGRATARANELAVRRALGAGRGRLVRQLVVEGLLLAGAAGVVGAGFAFVATRLLRGQVMPGLPALPPIPIDNRVIAFALLVSTVTGVLFAVVPALAVTRAAPAGRGESGRVVEGRSRLRTILVVSQIAISLALLVAAGLLLGTVRALRDVETGFDAVGVIEASVDPGTQGYDERARAAFFTELVTRSRALPGVAAAGIAWAPVQGFMRAGTAMRPEGEPSDSDRAIRGSLNIVSPGFIDALGAELVAGRDFRDDEFLGGSGSAGVVIISEAAAAAMFPAGNAVGKRIDTGTTEPAIAEIVGVVRDVRFGSMREPGGPLLLEPFGRAPWLPSTATLYVRPTQRPDAVVAAVRGIIGSLDEALPLYDVQRVSERLDRRLVTERRLASASALFAAIALLLAAVGLYGVMAFAVVLRAREFGVRMALGARATSVHVLVLRDALATAIAGIVIGLLLAGAVARLVSSRIWGLEPFDPAVFATCAAVLLGTALLASWLPASRATRVDPMAVLRQDST